MKNLVGLVTGSASGLGKATALRLLSCGMRVITFDKNFDDNNEDNFLNFTSSIKDDSMKEKINKNCMFISGNIMSPENIETAIATGVDAWGKLNVVVNCAGIPTSALIFNRKESRCCSLESFQHFVFTNVCGTFNVIRLAACQMAKNKTINNEERGVIINTGSFDAFKGNIHGSTNAASYGAITSMTLPIARDLSSLGIRVVTIAPGVFDTPIMEKMSSELKEFLGNCNVFPNRLGDPDEFAAFVETIIENKYLNGDTILLDAATFIPTFDIN